MSSRCHRRIVSGLTIVATWLNASTPLTIREPEPTAAQLDPQDSILFHQIRDHVLLLPIEPAGERSQEELQRGDGNNHDGRVYSTDEVLRFGRHVGRVWDTTGLTLAGPLCRPTHLALHDPTLLKHDISWPEYPRWSSSNSDHIQ